MYKDYRLIKFHPLDILFIKAADKYVDVHTTVNKQATLIRTTLESLEERLPDPLFCRVARSYIINVHHIEFVEKDTIRIGAEDIPLHKQYAPTFMQRLLRVN